MVTTAARTRLKNGILALDPFAGIAWHTAAWAGDPLWASPADGDPTASWRDGSGNGRTLTQPTSSKRPIFRASVAAMNNRPALEHDGIDDALATAIFTALPQPWSVVVVAKINTLVNDSYLSGANSGLHMNSGQYRFYAGTVLATTLVADTSNHLVHAVANAGSSKVGRDGSEQSGAAGANSLTELRTATFAASNFGAISVGFIGVFAGDVTAQGGWAAWKAAVAAHYVLTVV